MRYFDHDTDASSDDKINALRFFHGGAAVDAYWCIIERIYKDEEPLAVNDFNLASLAMRLNASIADVQTWIDAILEVGLLDHTDGLISDRIWANINAYHDKREQAVARGKASAKARQKKCKEVSNASETAFKNLSTKEKEKEKESAFCAPPAQKRAPSYGGDDEAAADDGSTWDWEGLSKELAL